MSRSHSSTAEDGRQWSLLGTECGEPWSGRARYAAAMYFYQRGVLSEAVLEVYRTCSVFDHEDPRPYLARLGLMGELDALQSAIEAGRHHRAS
jgi:hypothetical protein